MTENQSRKLPYEKAFAEICDFSADADLADNISNGSENLAGDWDTPFVEQVYP